jgi:uncharacterized protein (DUF58 family)
VITTDPDTLFDAAFLGRLESLSLLARQLVRSRQRSDRRSVQRGASVEFAEYRPFVSGDDWRYIDWNAFARWRQLVLKLFVEEEDLHVHLLLDCTVSMDWGAPVKFDYARQLIAGLAYITLANLDRAAVVPLGAEDYQLWPPARGRHRFLQLLRYLARCPLADAPTRLEDAARRWVATQPRRGMAIWVGDLFGADLGDALRALDRLRYSRHEFAIIQIRDPAESEAGEPGEYEVEDCETGAVEKVIVDGGMARRYRERFAEYQESILRYCRAYQIPLLQVSTEVGVPELITRSLMAGGFVK